jgi:uncharacterized membrane protein YfcA
VTTVELLAIMLSAVAGGAVQAALGFGGSFIMVPVVAVLLPDALPGAVLLGLLPLTLWVAWRDRAAIDRDAFRRITFGRVPGTVVATAVVALAPTRVLTVVIAVVLLLAVVANAMGWSVRTTPTSQGIAGFASGFTGTAAALGGPPLAVLYRDATGADRRGTLSAIFAVGIVLGLGTLAVVGEFGAGDVPAGTLLGLGLLGGALLVAPVVRRWNDDALRRAVLVWAAVGAATAFGRALL